MRAVTGQWRGEAPERRVRFAHVELHHHIMTDERTTTPVHSVRTVHGPRALESALVSLLWLQAGAGLQLAMLLQIALAFACFLGVLGMRLWCRGAARFGATPAMIAFVLCPLVMASGITTWAIGGALSEVALTGAGGVAATAAGSAEALIPLLLGAACGVALACVAVLVTAIGSSRAAPDTPARGPWLPLASFAVAALAGGLVILVVGMVDAFNSGLRDPQALDVLRRVAATASWGLAFLLVALTVAAAVRASRGPASAFFKLQSLVVLLGVGLGTVAALLGVQAQVAALQAAALTGVPHRGQLGVAVRDAAARFGATVDLDPLILSLGDDGGYWIDGRPADLEAVRKRLSALEAGRRVSLQAAGVVPYRFVSPILDAVREAGFARVGLNEPGQAVPTPSTLEVRLRDRPGGECPQQNLVLLVVGLGDGTVDVNRHPLGDIEALDSRLRDILQTRACKAVFLRPAATARYEQVLAAMAVLRNAGADPAVMLTPMAAEDFLPPPPAPPPPPPPTR